MFKLPIKLEASLYLYHKFINFMGISAKCNNLVHSIYKTDKISRKNESSLPRKRGFLQFSNFTFTLACGFFFFFVFLPACGFYLILYSTIYDNYEFYIFEVYSSDDFIYIYYTLWEKNPIN